MLEGITEWVWEPEREMKGWELEGRLDLLLENEDDELIDDDGHVDISYGLKRECWRRHSRSKRKMVKVSLSSSHAEIDVEVKRQKETDDVQLGHHVKEKLSMVCQRLASQRRVEAATTFYLRQ